ncbi:hypothetical protein NLG97_g11111 [Lecanicillium saksenae]|uniref:Uncharacterized protein n=1 Tax=Lecanicillium saksenae TaxID=468837 RepID=A0ACC1QE15_9HYPO|nr:hypothetical protein NLG97_g11111 [Lecanicillium saksenae]
MFLLYSSHTQAQPSAFGLVRDQQCHDDAQTAMSQSTYTPQHAPTPSHAHTHQYSMRNEMLALVQGNATPTSTTTSLWVALNQHAAIDPDLGTAWPTGSDADESDNGKYRSSVIGDGRGTSAMRKLTSPACILSYLLSWMLPTPINSDEAQYLWWSFAELQRASIRLGAFLRCRCGVEPGATAVFFSPVSAEWALLLSVASLNRYTAVTLPNNVLRPRNQLLQDQINDLAPSIIVVTSEAEARHVVANISTNISIGISLERFTKVAPDGWISMADIAAGMASQGEDYIGTMATLQDEPDDHERTAFVVCTSGSTGKPKGCPFNTCRSFPLPSL